tara:strand:+ start:312 stop:962 length:651 start_codon:yes stop_codon:yes gene_type:complete
MKKAQAQAIKDGFIASLGGKYDDVDKDNFPLIERILFDIGVEFTMKAKENLRKSKAIASGQLFDISVPQVYQNAFGGYTLEVGYPIGSKADKYYDYVNKGVRGTDNNRQNAGTPYTFKSNKKSIPVKPIQDWLKLNKSRTTSISKYSKLNVERKAIKDKKSLAFAIAKGIHKNGLKATRYFDDALKILKDKDFLDALSQALEGDIVIKLSSIQNKK